ncbi:hypothetical protein V6N13_125824 [Hibiscus sabdariffa]
MHFRGREQPFQLVNYTLPDELSWQPPQQGWFCLNTDVAVASATSMGSIGGVIHGSSDELWGIRIGLEIVWSMGVKQLRVLMDCKHAFNLVISDSTSRETPIVCMCYPLIAQPHMVH